MTIGIYLKLITPEAGGGFTYVDELMKALAASAKGHRHQFVLLCQGNGVVPVEESDSLTVVKMGSLLWRRFLTVLSVTNLGQDIQLVLNKKFSMIPPKVLRNNHIDLVWYPTGSLFGQTDAPYIATMWDSQHRFQPWFPELNSGGEWLLRERHYELFLRQASYVLAGNTASKEEIERFYGIASERIRMLAHPTPQFALAAGTVDSNILKQFSISSPFIFYPAQFWPHKNQQLLIKAVHVLKEQFGLIVSVALPGSNKGNRVYIEELAKKLGVRDQVHFLGFVSRNDLIYLYHHAFALVVPTFFGPENFPPLEAFALGCPVIASNVHGAAEQYGDAALLFDPKNYGELARLLKLLHDDKNLRGRLIERGRERAAKWSNKDYIDGMMGIFDEFETIRDCWPRL